MCTCLFNVQPGASWRGPYTEGADHGYDPEEPDMRGIFVAWGPGKDKHDQEI